MKGTVADAINYCKRVEADSQFLSWQKVDVPKIGSAELLFQVKSQILSLGGAKWQILSWRKVCVVKIGFGKEKKSHWGLSTRVLNFVGGIKKTINHNIGPFSQGGLEKPNPARKIDTLADGS